MLKNRVYSVSPGRSGATRPSLILGTVLWIAVLGSLFFVWQSRPAEPQAAETAEASKAAATTQAQPATSPIKPGESKSTWKVNFPAKQLPDFEFESCTGGTLSLNDLKGKRWVASFIFTSCTSTCPVITRAVMEVHDRVGKTAPDVMFVSFTVYPRVDTAEQLRNYSETFTKGNWDRWKFLTGSQQQIFELIVKGFGLYVKENVEAAKMPGFEVAHSNRVVLVNEDGIPVGTFLGTKPEDMVKLRRILTGKDDFPEPGAASGGLTISTTDGSPLNLQFEVQPATGNDDTSVEDSPDAAVPTDASSDDGGNSPTSTDTSPPEQQPAAETRVRQSAIEHNRSIDERMPAWARVLPTVNSGFNILSAVLLSMGLLAIKKGKKDTHRRFMTTAFITSTIFLGCYLTYHYALGKFTGEHGRKFPGEGVAAVVYQLILWPHIFLAVLVPIMAIRVFQHAFAERWDAHRKLAKLTFPIWMFVSVTGVVIYGMLYHWPWPAQTTG